MSLIFLIYGTMCIFVKGPVNFANLPSSTQHLQRENFAFLLPNSVLSWNGFTHAQLPNIRILVEFCIFGIQSTNSFKFLPIVVS